MTVYEYKVLFVSEAREHLQALNQRLLEWEKSPQATGPVQEIFRSAHTLKGMAAAMGYDELALLAHDSESLLDKVRKGTLVAAPDLIQLFFQVVDALATMLEDIVQNRESSLDLHAMLRRLNTYQPDAAKTTTPSPAVVVPAAGGEIPGPETPPSVSLPAAPAGRDAAPPETPPLAAAVSPTSTVRIHVKNLDTLLNLTGELVINRSQIGQIPLPEDHPEYREVLEYHDRLISQLQEAVLKTRMVPVAQVFNRFPRMVRDLAKQEGKQVELRISGEEIELDRTFLEAIADPLVHLLRNAIDHGLESPAERQKRGKPAQGVIQLTARRERDRATLEVSDDGQGMDVRRIAQLACERGLITAQAAAEMSEREILLLLCHPGFSLAETVTAVSGRGVGLDAVKRQVEALHGTLEISTRPNQGSVFRLILPVSMSIIPALFVGVGQEVYAIPLSDVAHAYEVATTDIVRIKDWAVIARDDEDLLPVLRLANILGDSRRTIPAEATSSSYVIVVQRSQERLALLADALLGKEEIVVKPLGGILKTIPGLAGATIRSDGQVALILDVPSLVAGG